ncbi:MAG TPA: glycosyltransferase [Gammaproteobacteria bacterium]|nr:glycosyltransferase [Gammaproteobacteria bacterium]
MKNIIILDPSCVDDSRTHHLYSLKGHAHVFHTAGYNVIAGSNINCTLELSECKNYPLFSYTVYDEIRSASTGKLKRFLKKPCYSYLVRKTAGSIRNLLDENNIVKSDHVFIPTCDWIMLQSLARLVKKNEFPPSLHLLFMYERANWMTAGYPYSRLLALLKELLAKRGNIYIYTETERHAANLENELGFRPASFPFPALPFDTKRQSGSQYGNIHIGALGGGRKDKGYQLLPGIIKKFNETCPDHAKSRFLIQRARQEDRINAVTKELELIDNVQLLDNQLGRDEYSISMMKCDIALFPYSDVYKVRGSGIVNEAVANGIPLVCSADTALSEAITYENGLTALTIEDYAQSIAKIIGNIDRFRKNAEVARSRFIENFYNNPVIRNIHNHEIH